MSSSDRSQGREGLSDVKRRLLERRIRARKGGSASSTPVAPEEPTRGIRPRPAGATPLSFAQTRLWFLDQLNEMGPAYNIAGALAMTGALDVESLQRAVEEIVRRHEALRTTLDGADGEPEQRIVSPTAFRLPVEDLSALEETEREVELDRRTRALAECSFDLAQGPLFRVLLLREGEREHRLVWCFHHTVSDIWSIGVFCSELAALYGAFRTGKPSPLPELPVQYGDFAVWQRQRLRGDNLRRQIEYWRRELGEAPPVLELPTDRPRPALQSYRGATRWRRLPTALVEAASALARREGATLYMVMMAVFQVLLSRYGRSDDFVVGSPIAGRDRSEVEGLLGLFVGTLSLRADLSGDPTFRDLVARVKKTALGAYAHSELPFEMLVDELKLRRDLSHPPVFQVLFGLQNVPTGEARFEGLETRRVEFEKDGAILDLSLYAWPDPEGMILTLEYNRDLFDEATVDRLLEHYGALLQAAVEHPELPVSRLELLPPGERRRVLLEWNDTDAPWERSTLHGAVFEQAARSPDAVAVEGGGESLTYSELIGRSRALARWLRAEGVGSETLVGIFMDRSPRLLVALLGVLEAGGAYLPLDPSFPAARLAYMVEHSAAPVILTESARLGEVPAGPRAVALDAEWPAVEAATGEDPPPARPEQLAYVIYTSGSTGLPKGVAIQHGSAANFLRAMADRPGLDANDRLLAVTTLSFDISVLELFLPLTVGARTVIATKEVAGDGEKLLEAIRAGGVTVMQATPATWQLLLETREDAELPPRVLCGGEALPRELASRLLERADSLVNLYGPTEATVWATLEEVTPSSRAVSIGRPIGNLRVFVLDAHLQPVAAGVPGDLYIGGAGVARGYLGRPELTADRFVPDPFAGREAPGRPGDRLYRTGDQACWLADGRLEFLGRDDHQVKVRGFRIELGEIESVLTEHPAVREAVVVARPDPRGETQIVGYLVPKGERPGVAELRAHLHERLPDYMVPNAWVYLDAFPLTPNRKIDRRALPAPDLDRPDLESPFAAPAGELEERLAALWRSVLDIDRVGRDDNFFELGGHSLLMVRLNGRVRRELGVPISLVEMFQYPSVRTMAGRLATSGGAEKDLTGVKDRAAKAREAMRRRQRPGRTRR